MLGTNYTDKEKLELFKSGDSEAFSFFYSKYASALYQFARRNIGLKEDSEEIIQDIFLDLWNRRSRLQHLTSMEGYLYQMVRYKVIRYFQHKGVVRKFEEHYKLFEVLYENPNFEDQTTDSIQHRIEKCLTGLPKRCCEAIRLRVFENLSNTEIADRMSITKGTVENYMVTAFDHIRACSRKLFKSA